MAASKALRVNLAWLILLFIDSQQPAASQSDYIRFTHLSVEHGLSHTMVNSINQDKQGFMWFGTEDGLNKYDGYGFQIYRPDPDNPNSLSGTSVNSIHVDNNGLLWIGTWGGGLTRFDPASETFSRYRFDEQNKNSLSHNHLTIGTIRQDRSGYLWIGTSGGGLNKLNPKTGHITRYQHDSNDPKSISSNRVNAIYPDPNESTIWVGTDEGLNKFDMETETFTHFRHNSDKPNSLNHNVVNAICLSNTKDHPVLWIGTPEGLDRFEPASEVFSHYPLSGLNLMTYEINGIIADSENRLWLTTNGSGLIFFDPNSGIFTRHQYQKANPNSLSNDVVYPIFQDRNGAFWIGTWGGGINRFDPNSQKFHNYEYVPDRSNSLPHSAVFTIRTARNGIVWIGTWGGGLSRFDPSSKTFVNYLHDNKNPNSLSDNKVGAIYEDNEGIIWVGTWTGGLDRLNPQTGIFNHYKHDDHNPRSLSDNRILAIIADEDDNLWVGTSGNGLNKFNKTTEKFIRYLEDLDEPDKTLLSIKKDKTGILWIGTANGLLRFNPKSGKSKKFKHSEEISSSISNDFVKTIYEDSQGQLWIGTNIGLNKFDKESGKFKRYFKKNGLVDNRISGIIEDDNGFLWVSTGHGLSRLDRQDDSFKSYDVEDGLQANLFYYQAAAKGKDGTLFFGGPNGLSVFHPDKLTVDNSIAPVVITALQIDNRSIKLGANSPLTRHINYTKEIVLAHTHSMIGFEFAALNYSAPSKNRYAYRLEGFDHDWHYVNSHRRFASYTNLDPGDYLFLVKASNNDGIWNQKGISMALTITPPWWQTLWFRLVILGLIASALLLGYRWRVQSIKIYNRHLKKLVDERTGELSAQTMALSLMNKELEAAKESSELANRAKSTFLTRMSHELRTPLNGILGYVQMLKSDKNLMRSKKARTGIETIDHSSAHLLNLINEILDLSKIEASKMELHAAPISLTDFLDSIIAMINVPATQKGLVISLKKSRQLPETVVADEKRIRQVLLNMLSNAVKFTDRGTITLQVILLEKSDQQMRLRFEVIDKGCGIPKNEIDSIFSPFKQLGNNEHSIEGTGLGLAISRKLLRLMESELNVESMVGVGSTFWFELDLPEPKHAQNPARKPAIGQSPKYSPQTPIIAPQVDELNALMALAEDGDFIALNVRLADLRESDSCYTPFVEKIRTMAKTFEDAEICRFIHSLLTQSKV